MHPNDTALNDYVDGGLGPAARDDIDRHLAGCTTCRQTVEDLRAILAATRELEPSEPPVRAWARLRTSDRARTAARRARARRTRGRARRPRRIGADGWRAGRSRWPLAAAIMLATWSGMRVTQNAPGAPASSTRPAGTVAAADAAGGDAAQSVETELRQAEAHYENAIKGLESDRQHRAERSRPAHRRDAAEESRGHRSGDQRKPRRGAIAAGQRAGAAESDRGLQDQDRTAAGHRRADQRNAKRQRRRGGANRLGSEAEGHLTCDSLQRSILAGLAFAAAPALAQDDDGRIVARVVVRDVTAAVRPGAYQGRNNGPEQTERFTRKVKIARDGRFTLSNIAGDITITAGSGDEVSIDAVKRTRGDKSELERVQITVDDRAGRVDVRTEHDGQYRDRDDRGRRSDHVSVDYTVAVPAAAFGRPAFGLRHDQGDRRSRLAAQRNDQRQRDDRRRAEARSGEDRVRRRLAERHHAPTATSARRASAATCGRRV